MKTPETRIATRITTLRSKGEKGFIAYITAGDPNLEGTKELVLRLEDAGVDIVELGIPFSDPLADGKVNQASAARALASGATLPAIWEMVRELRERTDMPLMSYCYMNLLYAGGFELSIKKAARAGLDGLLILDLPLEEAPPYQQVLQDQGLDRIVLITPTSPTERIEKIVRHASGFIYAVSRTGVTGMQDQVADEARDLLRRARRTTDLPIALGFGISTPEQAALAARNADAVVVGSAIVDRFFNAGSSPAKKKQAGRWVASMVAATKGI